MKRFLLILGAALLVVSAAHAADVTDGKPVDRSGRGTSGSLGAGWYDVDSTARYFRMNQAGDLKTYDQGPSSWTYFSRIYSDTLSRNGRTADSTGVYATGPYGTGVLYVYPITACASGDSLILAIQVRGHFQAASDSSSTFPLVPWANNPFGTGPGQRDKTGHLGSIGTAPGAAAEGTPGWSEYVVVIKPDVDFSNVAGLTTPGKGFPIPLYNLWTPYFSVRFRNLSRTGVTTQCRSRLDMTYVGTPLK